MPMPKSTTRGEREKFTKQLSDLSEDPPVSVALVDIDGFKQINDTYGHDVGDQILEVVHKALSALPSESRVIRTGGDEWACLIPKSGPEEALIALDGIRRKLEAKPHRHRSRSIPIKISAGIASFPHHTEEPSHLLQTADEAMHRAKREGKSRVAIFVEDKMVLKSNYYPRAQLARLSTLARATKKTEAALLREALRDLLGKHSEQL